jgi:catalase (peroxidase I)
MKRIIFTTAMAHSISAMAQEKPSARKEGATMTDVSQRREAAIKGTSNKDWWPNQLNLDVLRQQ